MHIIYIYVAWTFMYSMTTLFVVLLISVYMANMLVVLLLSVYVFTALLLTVSWCVSEQQTC